MENKNFLVTGASSGIGGAVSKNLLDSGAKVYGISRRQPAWDHEESYRENFHWISCDLADFNKLETTIKTILDKCSTLNGAIICHGFGDFGSLEEFSISRINALVDTNLTSTMFISRLVLPGMKKNKSGDLLLIGSEAGLKAGKKGAIYCATKFGLRGFVQALRAECAPSGVRIAIVNPGMVASSFFDKLDFTPGETPDNFLEPEDVAIAVKSVLDMPRGSVIDEINLSPQKTVIRNK